MAATALQVNPELIAVVCYQSTVQELTDIITHHSGRFRRIALGHLSNVADAEDALQDALPSALTHVQQFRGQAKMSTWLTRIVINSARMKLRRRLTSVQFTWDETHGQPDSPWKTQCRIRGQVRKRRIASEKLRKHGLMQPPGYRLLCAQPFKLRDVDGLSIRETAELLGVPTGTLKARLARARVRLWRNDEQERPVKA